MRGGEWTVGFDADDTLWHNERAFRATEEGFLRRLAAWSDPGTSRERLLAAERRNLGAYGFGAKGFTLSMIETAIEVTEGRVPARVIGEILAEGRAILDHPVELLPHAREAVAAARQQGGVVLVTKGDLLDQERKLAASGLGEMFDAVEIVSDKTPEIYARIFARHARRGRARSMMVGNSLRSDVIPALAAGAWAVHVPAEIGWALEAADPPHGHPRFREIANLGALAGLLAGL
jgi:putative hydrolase of the HAD superfamily